MPAVSPANSEQHYVFISFASGDAELAHRAVDALERAGIRCWISDRDIRMAASYPAAITAAIKGSGTLLLLLTAASNSSPHVLREVELAFNDRHPILPIRIAGTTPSSDLQYFLSTSQWLDAGSAFDDEDLAKIEPVLRELLERGKPGVISETGASRRWVWAAVAAVLILVVSAAVMFRARGRRQVTTTAAVTVPAESPVPPVTPAPTGAPTSRAAPTATGAAASTTAPSPTHRIEKINPRDGQAYAWIAPGRFAMGCSEGDPACDNDEKPVHAVAITRGFWLSKTEVTEAQYRRRRAARGATPAHASTELPVTQVNWSDAKAYCAGVGGRLPTEAEWEYAARAGTTTRYYDTPAATAWFSANSDGHPHAVGTKLPNAFGLYDMLGNVSEWVLDRYYNAYDDTDEAVEEPLAGNASGVARGGSWTSEATGVRVSRRLEMPPDAEEPHIGFRCALDRL